MALLPLVKRSNVTLNPHLLPSKKLRRPREAHGAVRGEEAKQFLDEAPDPRVVLEMMREKPDRLAVLGRARDGLARQHREVFEHRGLVAQPAMAAPEHRIDVSVHLKDAGSGFARAPSLEGGEARKAHFMQALDQIVADAIPRGCEHRHDLGAEETPQARLRPVKCGHAIEKRLADAELR